MEYDIIGDIHGYATKLERLLIELGYRKANGIWRHAHRTAVFTGDFVDLGPEQFRCIDTVRRMVDAGTALAVMGNHELNAIAWHTPDLREPGEYLRPHFSEKWGAKNRTQHRAFLAEVEHWPRLHAEIIDWFLTLPLWLDLPGLRVVHACWHTRFMEQLSGELHKGRLLTRDLMIHATKEPADPLHKDDASFSIFKAVEALTKGIEIPLPEPHFFLDKYGIRRDRVRVKWWDTTAITYRTAAMLPSEQLATLPDDPIPDHARVEMGEVPVISVITG